MPNLLPARLLIQLEMKGALKEGSELHRTQAGRRTHPPQARDLPLAHIRSHSLAWQMLRLMRGSALFIGLITHTLAVYLQVYLIFTTYNASNEAYTAQFNALMLFPCVNVV